MKKYPGDFKVPIYPAPVIRTAPQSFHRAWKDPALSASARYLPSFSAGLQGFFHQNSVCQQTGHDRSDVVVVCTPNWQTPISWDNWLMGYLTDAWETPSQSSHPPIIIPQVLKTHGARSGMSCGGHVMPSGERATWRLGLGMDPLMGPIGTGQFLGLKGPIQLTHHQSWAIFSCDHPIWGPFFCRFCLLTVSLPVDVDEWLFKTIQTFWGVPGFDACTQMSKTIFQHIETRWDALRLVTLRI